MTIAAIIAYPVSTPRPSLSGRSGSLLTSVVVEVQTTDGLSGFGEALCFAAPRATAALVTDVFAPLLTGRDERAIGALWESMRQSLTGAPAGAAAEALSAVDIALWDLLGQALDSPIYELLGGCGRQRLPAYASFIGWVADRDAVTLAETMVESGFRCLKVKVMPPLAAAMERCSLIRQTVGGEIDLVVDPNGKFSRVDAIAFARHVSDLGYLWLEEPIDPQDHTGMADISRLGLLSIAGGESEYSPRGALNLATGRSVDILQPDCGRIGGITGFVRAISASAALGLPFAPHHAGGAIKAAAALHLAAALPGFLIQECSVLRTPLQDDLTEETVAHPGQLDAEGALPVLGGPGLGITIRRDTLERLRLH